MRNLRYRKSTYVVFAGDCVLAAIAFWLAYAIRFEFQIPAKDLTAMLQILPVVLLVKLSIFALSRLYQCLWRYISLRDLLKVIEANVLSTLVLIFILLTINRFQGYPRSVFILDWGLSILLIGGTRVGIRLYFSRQAGVDFFPALSRLKPGGKKLLIIETGSFLLDLLLVAVAFYLAYAIRFEFQIPPEYLGALAQFLPLVLIVKMGIFVFFHMYQGMWRFMGLIELIHVVKAIVVSSLGVAVFALVLHRFAGYPRSVFIIDGVLTLFFIGGVRLGIRLYFSWHRGLETLPTESGKYSQRKRLLIIGAGRAGEKILRDLLDNPALKFTPAGFLDDSPEKRGKTIHGVEVLGPIEQLDALSALYDELLIALPSASAEQMRTVVAACERTGKRFRIVPAVGELIDGKVSVKTIRDVTLQDLLGREEVRLSKAAISAYLHEKRVMITGAGGSIGSELVRQVSKFQPGALALVEMSEFNLFRTEIECRQRFAYVRTTGFLVDIRDQASLNQVFEKFRPQVVLHTAAYKHVPLQELHPWEAVRNNVLGTSNLVQAAQNYGVEKFVTVSTDKAVRPTNVMGATKRIAEKLVLSANGRSQCQFMVVRFGNVMGSSGSVIPTFQDQITRGGPVTVTHPAITRYFMSIPEAAQLLLQAGSMGDGGEIFILDMGEPVRIAELARELIRLHGYEPDRDIMIQYTGLRPGEKLYEELITAGEGIVKTEHRKILVLRGEHPDWEKLQQQSAELFEIAQTYNSVMIKLKLQELVPEYTPEFRRFSDVKAEQTESRSVQP